MMKKSCLIFITTIAMILLLATSGLAAVVISPQTVYVDGSETSFEVYNIDGNNYFKLRDIAYVLSGTEAGFSVQFDADANMISIVTDMPYVGNGSELIVGNDKSATAKRSNQSLMINGTTANLLAYNIGGNNFFQLRALGKALDFGVNYDSIYNSIIIQSDLPYQEPTAKLTAEQIYAKCSPAVFYIEVYDSNDDFLASGSGFFVDSNGTALTNFHVIEGGASAKITLSATGKTYDVLGVYDYNAAIDLAYLKIDGSNFPYLETGDSKNLLGGATIYTIGSPLGLQNTITQGIISNTSRVYDDISYIQISAAISSGSSGGALINESGKVIGVTCAYFVGGQNLNLAVPIHYAADLTMGKTYQSLASIFPASSNDAYGIVVNYLTSQGYYDSEYDCYSIAYTETGTNNEYDLIYYQGDDYLVFGQYQENEQGPMLACIYIEGISDTYSYGFYLLYTHTMGSGTLDASSFSESTNLNFTSYSGNSSNKGTYEDTTRDMMWNCLQLTEWVFWMEGIDASIQDFGFDTAYAAYYTE
jgi:hypothetical protein